MSPLHLEIHSAISPKVCSRQVAAHWLRRLEEKELTRDGGNPYHFCCYFLPYNPETEEVFIVHHKKSGLWLAPGGHIDPGERLMRTLNREIEEELGAKYRIAGAISPFLLTITPIDNPLQPRCKEHLDLWYRFASDGSEFKVDPAEFHETKWTKTAKARELMTDPPNLEAISKMEELFASLKAA